MGRMTRKKAAEVAEQLHIDGDEVLELPSDETAILTRSKRVTPEPTTRPPLGELAPNSAESKSQSEDGLQELRKSTRAKKGKRAGAKGDKDNFAASTASQRDFANEDGTGDVLPDDNDSVPSPASEKAAEDLMNEVPSPAIQDTSMPPSPPSSAVKSARNLVNQLRRPIAAETGATEPSVSLSDEDQTSQAATMKEETTSHDIPAIKMHDSIDIPEDAPHSSLDAPTSPLPSAMPNVVKHLRMDTPAKRSTSNKENIEPDSVSSPQPSNYDQLEDAVVTSTSPQVPSRQSSPSAEDLLPSMDKQEEAVVKPEATLPTEKAAEKPQEKRKSSWTVRTTKAAAARISLAHNRDAAAAKQPALGRPRPSTTLGRSSSVRDAAGSQARVTSTGSSSTRETQASEGAKKEILIPHSKPRPMSMSFPMPPPPPKSTKPPTQSTFQLPGEAVAAKLKAQREARQQKEEPAEKKAFKARPVPTSLSKAPIVRPTNTSRARESVMTGKDLKPRDSSALRQSVAHKRANSVAVGASSRLAHKPTPSSTLSTSTATRPRPATALANISKPRESISGLNGSRVVSNPGKGTSKGKEVFNRAANAKAAADKEKADREAAAKKARADAAERSRLLSREFAEKQKAKKLAAAATKVGEEGQIGGSAVAVV